MLHKEREREEQETWGVAEKDIDDQKEKKNKHSAKQNLSWTKRKRRIGNIVQSKKRDSHRKRKRRVGNMGCS